LSGANRAIESSPIHVMGRGPRRDNPGLTRSGCPPSEFVGRNRTGDEQSRPNRETISTMSNGILTGVAGTCAGSYRNWMGRAVKVGGPAGGLMAMLADLGAPVAALAKYCTLGLRS